jgi:hypothetical protein
MSHSSAADTARSWIALDFRPPHDQPRWPLVVLGTIASLVGSLVADAIIVALGTRVFPSTRGYVHFQFSDYAKLTVIGVLVACVGWPVVTRMSSNPKRLYLLLAIGTTVVLFAPDIWILHNGAPAKAVAILMIMHVAIAVVTYVSMVYLAPARRRPVS